MPNTSVLIIIGLLVLSGSGFFLKYILKFKTALTNCMTPLVFTLIGVASATQLRNFEEAIIFFGAAVVQFASFIFVSRFRQRSSFFWHTISAIMSNGGWYVTMGMLSKSQAYWLLFVPHIIGIVAGRTAGVVWAQYIEEKYELKADATLDGKLAPGKRLAYLCQEKMFWILTTGLVFYLVYGYFGFTIDFYQSVLVVIGLGLLQNFSHALNTRASARGNNWYIAITGLFAGVTFYLSAIYLFSKGMPIVLFIPYTLSTALGSATGAFFSMIIEWIGQMSPDKHLKENKTASREGRGSERLPYILILILALAWIFFQESFFKILGYPVNQLKFPISAVTVELPRVLIMLIASLTFFFDTALHTMNSRAGSRSHTGYHVVTCVPKGLMDFAKISYIAQNSKILDVLPIGILASCLGSLCGKDVSEKIEKWLQARMDVVEPIKKTALSS